MALFNRDTLTNLEKQREKLQGVRDKLTNRLASSNQELDQKKAERHKALVENGLDYDELPIIRLNEKINAVQGALLENNLQMETCLREIDEETFKKGRIEEADTRQKRLDVLKRHWQDARACVVPLMETLRQYGDLTMGPGSAELIQAYFINELQLSISNIIAEEEHAIRLLRDLSIPEHQLIHNGLRKAKPQPPAEQYKTPYLNPAIHGSRVNIPHTLDDMNPTLSRDKAPPPPKPSDPNERIGPARTGFISNPRSK
jgi:hypothetical protein